MNEIHDPFKYVKQAVQPHYIIYYQFNEKVVVEIFYKH